MGSTTRTQSNHYETLAIDPAASNDQIVQAFSAQMRSARVRPDISVARLAQLSVAYETLRDPLKRRAYDVALGLKPELMKPVTANPAALGGATILERLNRVAEMPPGVASRPERPVAAQPAAESRVAGFIAASVREPVKRVEPELTSPPAPPPPLAGLAAPAIEARSPLIAEATDIEDRLRSIGRGSATAGAGIIGVAVLALALALPSGNPDRLTGEVGQPQPAVTVPLPAAAAAQDSEAALQPAVTVAAKASPTADFHGDRLPHSPDALPLPSTPAIDQPTADQPAAQPAVTLAASDGGQDDTEPKTAQASSDTPADASLTVKTSAALPLPESTIARTIQRIGYGCGSVVSATSVDGSDGVFKITCSSGDIYRAAPVAGRYHFRRWGSH